MELQSTSSVPWLYLKRVVRFGDTDAAGVMHFHHLFRWCHEAWEESLETYGLSLNQVFPDITNMQESLMVGLPIVHCEADFFLPMTTGDHLEIELLPLKLDVSSFEMQVRFKCLGQETALALIRHVAINFRSRKRCPLPNAISLWLEDSAIKRA